ncbi:MULTISPECIES: hypothetical protein [Ruminococcus]|uniref:Uncharacterized protein n=1 Tax=Ruminococcus albus (strain ATCC 27210 / DSM 20455 / JCM 14654 / NCDO 2250 / 7) TaxID=697329 RepID=E6UL56_RUMA7|nr:MULTISPECIES: hypothetical protein [Ruminococcus]ADU24402.1 hypothetical protein Rumal_3979 [Ruminococcus albus 7 = DSM 20455]MCR5021220.1 hypothetical protein [Ruminococcus sp.]
MILEIEYYKADTQLVGKARHFSEVKEQLEKAEHLHDRVNDNFIELLCRMFGWTENKIFCRPDLIYDRDIMKLSSTDNRS